MSINQVYQLEQPSHSFKLQDSRFKSIKKIGSDDSQTIISVKHETGKWDVISVADEGGDQILSKILYTSLPWKPVYVCVRNQILLSHSSATGTLYCTTLNEDWKTSRQLRVTLHPTYAFPLSPHLDATLLLSKHSVENLIFMHSPQGGQPTGPSQSLTRVLHPYTTVNEISHCQDRLCLGVTRKIGGIQEIIVLTLTENRDQQGRKEFQIINKIVIDTQPQAIQMISITTVMICLESQIFLCEPDDDKKIIKHSFNMLPPIKYCDMQDGQAVIQDSAGDIFIFDDGSFNKFYLTSDNINHRLLRVGGYAFALCQDPHDQTSYHIERLVPHELDSVIQQMLESEETFAALQIIRSTGKGKESYLQQQMKKGGYNNTQKLQEFLASNHQLSSEQLIAILKSNENMIPESFGMILEASFLKCPKDKDELVRILDRAICRFRVYTTHKPRISTLAEFTLSASLPMVLTSLLTSVAPSDLQELLTSLLQPDHLPQELLTDYPTFLLQSLPLEYLNIPFLIRYLLPHPDSLLGKSQSHQGSSYDYVWLAVCRLLIQEADQPGKAAQLARAAAEQFGIDGGIIQVAKEAIDEVFKREYQQTQGTEWMLHEAVVGGREIRVKVVAEYFDQCQWVFERSKEIYQGYITEVKECVKQLQKDPQNIETSLELILGLLKYHKTTGLLFLHDKDIVTIAVNLLYSCPLYGPQHSNAVSSILHLLHDCTLSTNQQLFITTYLSPHLTLASSVLHQDYEGVFVSFQDLLLIQSSTKNANQADIVQKLRSVMTQMIEVQIKKHKKATGGVKGALNIRGRGERQGLETEMWVNTLHDMVQVKDQLNKDSTVDVYSIFIKKLLENKVTSSIEQLIKAAVIPVDELQTSVLRHLQESFNSCESDNFYQFAQSSKQFLDLLKKTDTERLYAEKIDHELKLIECAFFLKQNGLLFDHISNVQIRRDFQQGRLLDRILQIHGFKTYPDSFSTLVELQSICDQTQVYMVIVKVFKYLDHLQMFETADSKPNYTKRMIEQLVLNREQADWVNHEGIGNILFKIALISSDDSDIKNSLLRFLLIHLDKRDDTYYFLCRELMTQIYTDEPQGFLEDLQSALQNGLLAKAKFLISKAYRQSSNMLEVFSQIGNRGDFTHYQLRKLAKVLNLDLQVRARLKELGDSMEFKELVTLISDQGAFDQHIKHLRQQSMRKTAVPSEGTVLDFPMDHQDLSTIRRLITCQDAEEASMIIDMEYSDWQGDLDLQKIILDIGEYKGITEAALTSIIARAKQKVSEPSTSLKLDSLIELSQKLPELSILLLADAYLHPMPDPFSLLLTPREPPLIKHFRSLVTDFNLLTLCLACEDLSPLIAGCLYVNKLLAFLMHHKSIPATFDFYAFIERDTLEEMMEDDGNIQKINDNFMRVLASPRVDTGQVMIQV